MRNLIMNHAIIILSFMSLFIVTSCDKKNDETTPKVITIQDIVGTWEFVDGSYIRTLIFDYNDIGKDAFVEGKKSGTASYSWQLDNNTITFKYVAMSGDFGSHHDIQTHQPITSEISLSNNELTLTIGGTSYKYKHVESIKLDMYGSWVRSDNNYKNILTLDTASSLGVDAFVDDMIVGAAEISWDLFGNILMMNYGNKMLGSYESYNEIAPGSTLMSSVKISGNVLTVTYDGVSYNYNSTTMMDPTALEGSWRIIDGNYTSIITANHSLEATPSGMDSFIDDMESGFSSFEWLVSGELFVMNYTEMLGDYESYSGTSSGSTKYSNLSLSEDQLIFSNGGKSYTYSQMTDNEITEHSELKGRWLLNEGNYSDTLSFEYTSGLKPNKGIDSFTTDTKSGIADFQWKINGNILTIVYGNMIGDYESYHGIASGESTTSFANLADNQLIIIYKGNDYTYTKLE